MLRDDSGRSLSVLNHIWGRDRTVQLTGLLFVIICMVLFLLCGALWLLRSFDLGEEILIRTPVYLTLIVVIALAFSIIKRFKIAALLLGLFFVEFTLGYVPLILTNPLVGLQSPFRSFLPTVTDQRFSFHPTLAAIPTPNFDSGSSTHNSYGTRNTGEEFDPNKPHIAFFGGSTTYDTRIKNDADTWVGRVNAELPMFSVSNNGVPGYSTVENTIQTAFYEGRAGSQPICAVYYLGWNDIRNFGMEKLDNGYANFHLPSQYGGLRVRFNLNSPSAALNIISASFFRNELPLPVKTGHLGKKWSNSDDVFRIAKRNVGAISAINKTRNIRTIIIPQLLNRARLTSKSESYGWLPFVYDADVWPLQQRFNLMLSEWAVEFDFQTLPVEVELFTNSHFSDNGHFNELGAELFSALISKELTKICKIPPSLG